MKYIGHKGYVGSIEYSKEDGVLFGKVQGIRGLLSYEGTTGKELEANFRDVIDEYLEDCQQQNILPEKSFKGSFNVRIPAELHRDAALKAIELDISLNNFVIESIRSSLTQKLK